MGAVAPAEPATSWSCPAPWRKLMAALRANWPEYLIEGWALGMFMVSAGVVGVLLESSASPLRPLIEDATVRRVLGAIAMGLTAIALIYSPWGRRSGAHMNPAVTLTFLRLGKVAGADATFYVLAQFIGGTLGVVLVWILFGASFTEPPVAFATTVPGPRGVGVALLAEFAISFGLMYTILRVSSHARLERWTGMFAGALVALFISLEAPLSGTSMNPARTFASAAPAGHWMHLWLYFLAPVLGMLAAGAAYRRWHASAPVHCAKLRHSDGHRCIHCGYQP